MWRLPASIYYHSHIHEVPSVIPPQGAIPSPSALVPKASKQPLVAQTALLLPEASKGSSETRDQGQGAKGAKEKGKGTKPSSEAKDATKAKKAKAKAKEAETKNREVDPKANDATKAKEAEAKANDAPTTQSS